MSTTNNIGPKRLVVGAHYGLRDWLAQRITAMVIGVYAVVLFALALATSEPGYGGWAGIFSATWMKVFTLLTVLALIYHAWVGVRDIWMDYVKPVGVRLGLQIVTILWLIGCGVWAVEILWRV